MSAAPRAEKATHAEPARRVFGACWRVGTLRQCCGKETYAIVEEVYVEMRARVRDSAHSDVDSPNLLSSDVST